MSKANLYIKGGFKQRVAEADTSSKVSSEIFSFIVRREMGATHQVYKDYLPVVLGVADLKFVHDLLVPSEVGAALYKSGCLKAFVANLSLNEDVFDNTGFNDAAYHLARAKYCVLQSKEEKTRFLLKNSLSEVDCQVGSGPSRLFH